MHFDEQSYTCPYCYQPNTVGVDPSVEAKQTFTEDCTVCCRPIEIEMTVLPSGRCKIRVRRENGSGDW